MRIAFLFAFIHSVGFAQTDLRGLEWEDDTYRLLPLKASYFQPAGNFPAAFSLKRYCPRIVNQAGTNTGVAWAAVWYARTITQAVDAGWHDQSITQNAFSPGFNYKPDSRGGCDAPVKLSSVLSSLHSDGALPFSTYRQLCEPDSISSELIAVAQKNRLSGYVRLFNVNDAKEVKIRAIKEAIIAKHPVVLGIICPPSFSFAKDFWQPREEPDRQFGGHAVCVVGYDDAAFGGTLEIANSWGRDWAAEGFTALRYEDVQKFGVYAFEFIGAPSSPDGLTASVTLTQSNGSPMFAKLRNNGYYKLNRSWPTGTQFQIKTYFNNDIFFYAVAFDEKRNHEVLYPPERSVYSWLPKQDRIVVLPDASHSVTLTEPAGKNYMLLVFSGREMKAEELVSRLKEGKGEFGQPLTEEALSRISWNPESIGFNSEWSGNSLITVIIEVDQTH